MDKYVICRDNTRVENQITMQRVYKVIEESANSGMLNYLIENDNGEKKWYLAGRFVNAPNPRELS